MVLRVFTLRIFLCGYVRMDKVNDNVIILPSIKYSQNKEKIIGVRYNRDEQQTRKILSYKATLCSIIMNL